MCLNVLVVCLGGWFVTYEYVKYLTTPPGSPVSTSSLLVAGGAAGIVTWTMTYPFDVIVSFNNVHEN